MGKYEYFHFNYDMFNETALGFCQSMLDLTEPEQNKVRSALEEIEQNSNKANGIEKKDADKINVVQDDQDSDYSNDETIKNDAPNTIQNASPSNFPQNNSQPTNQSQNISQGQNQSSNLFALLGNSANNSNNIYNIGPQLTAGPSQALINNNNNNAFEANTADNANEKKAGTKKKKTLGNGSTKKKKWVHGNIYYLMWS